MSKDDTLDIHPSYSTVLYTTRYLCEHHYTFNIYYYRLTMCTMTANTVIWPWDQRRYRKVHPAASGCGHIFWPSTGDARTDQLTETSSLNWTHRVTHTGPYTLTHTHTLRGRRYSTDCVLCTCVLVYMWWTQFSQLSSLWPVLAPLTFPCYSVYPLPHTHKHAQQTHNINIHAYTPCISLIHMFTYLDPFWVIGPLLELE